MYIKGTPITEDFQIKAKAICRQSKKMEGRVIYRYDFHIYRCLYSSCSVETKVLPVGLKCPI